MVNVRSTALPGVGDRSGELERVLRIKENRPNARPAEWPGKPCERGNHKAAEPGPGFTDSIFVASPCNVLLNSSMRSCRLTSPEAGDAPAAPERAGQTTLLDTLALQGLATKMESVNLAPGRPPCDCRARMVCLARSAGRAFGRFS